MTLLTTVFAAIICTVIWYATAPKNDMKIGTLCLIYWGASLMLFEYAELSNAYFTPDPAAMLNDFYLGLTAVALGLLIWLAILLVKDPRGVVRLALWKRKTDQ